MIRLLCKIMLCMAVFTLSACSKRERSDPNADEWKNIQALADDAVIMSEKINEATNSVVEDAVTTAPPGEFGAFILRLEQMKTVERKRGQTLLTGENLVFDHDGRHVRMDHDVVVSDDQGTLETECLIARFSISNEVEYIEAKDGVVVRSETREAKADQAVYDYKTGFIQLEGMAVASDGGIRLSGERIELMIKGDRKMVCKPNALLEVSGSSGLMLDGAEKRADGDTEVRAESIVYDESRNMVELLGSVRIRDPHAAINCEIVRIYLKEDNEIDWIEAESEVIIQSGERKALSDKATYHANEGKFILDGDPKVKQGQNIMTGNRITFWHETRRMVCEPNARVLLYLDEETKAKFLNDLNE